MQRLRVLSEAECYTRLYGRDGDSAVNVLHDELPALRRVGLSSEELSRLFDHPIDDPLRFEREDAA